VSLISNNAEKAIVSTFGALPPSAIKTLGVYGW
jgi:hypothetical protein